jgi:hypothetical protein
VLLLREGISIFTALGLGRCVHGVCVAKGGTCVCNAAPRSSALVRPRVAPSDPGSLVTAPRASTHWAESIAPGEEESFGRLADQLAQIQRARAEGGASEAHRALHAKSHAGLRGHLVVADGLAEHLRHGLFGGAREYQAWVRFSNGSGGIEPDHKPDLRGLAVKVLGVKGPKALGEAETQDFLLIDSPVVPFRTPEEFVRFVTVASGLDGAARRSSPPSAGELLGGLAREFGLVGALRLLWRVGRRVKGGRSDVADLAYYAPAAMAFGPYAARIAAFPVHAPSVHAQARGGPGSSPDYLGERLRARIQEAPLEFDLKVQLFTDVGCSIEDSSSPWASPFEHVGKLVVFSQKPTAALQDLVEKLSFDPWHALSAHRPLGAVMRARKSAYFASTKHRGARAEPGAADWQSFDRPPVTASPASCSRGGRSPQRKRDVRVVSPQARPSRSRQVTSSRFLHGALQ